MLIILQNIHMLIYLCTKTKRTLDADYLSFTEGIKRSDCCPVASMRSSNNKEYIICNFFFFELPFSTSKNMFYILPRVHKGV